MFLLLDCKAVWCTVRRDVGEDADGRRRRLLHARARDPQG